MSEATTAIGHDSANGDDAGVLRCDACRMEWPCRDHLLRVVGQQIESSSTEYNRHRAAEEEQEAMRLRLFARYDRIVVIPLIVVAVLEFGILAGLWIAS